MPTDSCIESVGQTIAEIDLQLAHHCPQLLVRYLDRFVSEAIEQVVTDGAIEDLGLLRHIGNHVEP